MIDNAKLTEIKERVEETPFDKAYVKGDPWKGYEVRSESNEQTIAETSSGTDAEFIAHAYEDIPMLVVEVERLRTALIKINADPYHGFKTKRISEEALNE